MSSKSKQRSANDELAYWLAYAENCWRARQYYKDEQNKLLFWLGTTITAVIVFSGFLGAYRPSGAMLKVELEHVVAFHTIFFVVYLFYLYKKLNSDLYDMMGRLSERYLIARFDIASVGAPAPFFLAKPRYLSPRGDWAIGRGLSAAANIFIIGFYLALITYVVGRGALSSSGVYLNWRGVASVAVFTALFGVAFHLYRRAREQMRERVKDQWDPFLDTVDLSVAVCLGQPALDRLRVPGRSLVTSDGKI